MSQQKPISLGFKLRNTRSLTCAPSVDPGTVEIVPIILSAQPSEKPSEVTIQHQSFRDCPRCGGEAGLHLAGCPEMAAVLAESSDAGRGMPTS